MKIKAKKSLGQNFLIDQNIIKKIVSTTKINSNDSIFEIGPGTGNLSIHLINKKPKKFFAIEKDTNLVSLLNKKFENKINIINEDILKFNIDKITKDKLIVFGNLPYNISTQILINWITNDRRNPFFKKLILMFQKEVAERILAKTNSKNYGRLSVVSNWRLEIKKEFDISPQCFYPKPKIDSTLLSFIPKKKFVDLKNPKNLEYITRIFFSQKRKMINKPLKRIFKNHNKIAKDLKLNINQRPQNLSPKIYFDLTKEYEKLSN
tara:strand:- start:1279 stop:2070 length:792 start_codon:yes stop_codon:yes gene_type:complete